MANKSYMSAAESVNPDSRIISVKNRSVILDADLAKIYGVMTHRLNEAVKRNRMRFPPDFVFQLDKDDVAILISQNAISSSRHGGARKLPWAFTEHGALMAAMLLKSPRAVEMSVFVIRAFIRMREQLSQQTELEARLAYIEKTLLSHDAALRDLYQKLRPLLSPPPDPPKKAIGFHAKESRGRYRMARKMETS